MTIGFAFILLCFCDRSCAPILWFASFKTPSSWAEDIEGALVQVHGTATFLSGLATHWLWAGGKANF